MSLLTDHVMGFTRQHLNCEYGGHRKRRMKIKARNEEHKIQESVEGFDIEGGPRGSLLKSADDGCKSVNCIVSP